MLVTRQTRNSLDLTELPAPLLVDQTQVLVLAHRPRVQDLALPVWEATLERQQLVLGQATTLAETLQLLVVLELLVTKPRSTATDIKVPPALV